MESALLNVSTPFPYIGSSKTFHFVIHHIHSNHDNKLQAENEYHSNVNKCNVQETAENEYHSNVNKCNVQETIGKDTLTKIIRSLKSKTNHEYKLQSGRFQTKHKQCRQKHDLESQSRRHVCIVSFFPPWLAFGALTCF